MTDYEIIISCAVRYALGRETYIVSLICDYILKHIDALSINCLWSIAKDIRDQEQWGYGAECDEHEWMELLKTIEDKVRKR